VQRARPSYNPRGTCPRWADTPAAPGWAKPDPDSSKHWWKKRNVGEMFEERHSHLMKCLCPIAWAWLHVVAGRGCPVEGVDAIAVADAVAVAIAVAIGLSLSAMSSQIMMLSRRGSKSSRNFSFRRRGTSPSAQLCDGLRQPPWGYAPRPARDAPQPVGNTPRAASGESRPAGLQWR
jgi:hypothetical protein